MNSFLEFRLEERKRRKIVQGCRPIPSVPLDTRDGYGPVSHTASVFKILLVPSSPVPTAVQPTWKMRGKNGGGRWTLVRWWNKGKVEEETGKMFRYEETRGRGGGEKERVSTSKDTSLSNISTATKAPYSRNPRPSRTTHRLFSIFRYCFEPRLYRVFPHFQRLYRIRGAGYFWWWWWASILIITFRLKKRDDSLNLSLIFLRVRRNSYCLMDFFTDFANNFEQLCIFRVIDIEIQVSSYIYRIFH